MKDKKLYGFCLMELKDKYAAFKTGKDGTEISLTIGKDFLKKSDDPLKMTRSLELIFKEFLKEAQDKK